MPCHGKRVEPGVSREAGEGNSGSRGQGHNFSRSKWKFDFLKKKPVVTGGWKVGGGGETSLVMVECSHDEMVLLQFEG